MTVIGSVRGGCAVMAVSLFVTAALPARATAQMQPWVAFDAAVGMAHGVGNGADYSERGLPTAEVLVALRLRGTAGHAPIVGVSAGWAGVSGDYACVGGVPCGMPFPLLRYRTVQVGWEHWRPRGMAVRVLAGMAWDAHTFHIEGVRRGWQGRADVATRALGPVAAVAHVQVLQAPSGPRGTGMWGAGVGLRVR